MYASFARARLTVVCLAGAEVGLEVSLDMSSFNSCINPQLWQTVGILAVLATRTPALVQMVIAPLGSEISWQDLLQADHTVGIRVKTSILQTLRLPSVCCVSLGK